MNRRTTRNVLLALLVAAGGVGPLGCGSPADRPPEILLFDANPPFGEAPLTTALYWEIEDPDGDVLTCEIDFNGDGIADHTLRPCTSDNTQDIVAEHPGRHIITLTVSDGKHRVSRELPVYANNCPLPTNVFYPEDHPGLVDVVLGDTTTELLYADPTTAPEVPINTWLVGSSNGGYLRFVSGQPVVSISTGGARISLLTEKLALEQFVPDCYFGARGVRVPFTAIECVENCDRVESVEYIRPDDPGVKGGVSVGADFNFVDLDLGDGAKFKAGLSLSAEISRFEVDISWGSLRRFTVEISPSATGSVTMDVPLPGVTVSHELDLGKYYLSAFPLGPVMITPVLELEGGVNLGIEPKYKIGATMTVSAAAGFTWHHDADMEHWFTGSITPGVIDPSFDVGIGSARAFLKPKVALLVYGIVGPSLGAEAWASASASADLLAGEVCVDAKAGLDLVLGAELDLFLIEFGHEWSHNLAQHTFYSECFGGASCGDGDCDASEDCTQCPADCGACPGDCGDDVCDEAEEDCATCPDDCGECPENCGDEVLDGDEYCDPPSSCPTDCDDGDPCTVDELLGSAAACSARCNNELILQCVDGDGCCAVGCDQTSDTDCSASCGDGVVDPGEQCDPASVEGCPTSCDPMNGCTVYTLTGSDTNCTARCVESQQTSCVHNDGCCPSGQGCIYSNDNDCSPVCGDDKCEGDETPSSCPADCESNDPCVGFSGWYCGQTGGFGGVGGTLYHCYNEVLQNEYVCQYGCVPAPAGQPDDCAPAPVGEYADPCSYVGDPFCGPNAPNCSGSYCCIGTGFAEPGDFCSTGDDCCSGHCHLSGQCCWNPEPPGCML